MNLIFQSERGARREVVPERASFSFSGGDSGNVFVYYDEGDCDVFLPYVNLVRR